MAEEIYSDYHDFVVTGINFALRRQPDPAWTTPRRSYIDPLSHILVYALSGRARYEFEGAGLGIRGGDVMFFPRGMPHTGASVAEDPWEFISVGFEAQALHGDIDAQLGSLRRHWRGAVTDRVRPLLSELHVAWNDQKPGYLVRCRSLVMSSLYALIREDTQPHLYSPHSQKIVEIIAMMREGFDQTFSVESLARQAGLSASHFRHLFKEFTGLTVKEYHHRIKVSRAKELLLSGECNVTEAAARTGFSDIYYFSRLFKKVAGASPSEYTKR